MTKPSAEATSAMREDDDAQDDAFASEHSKPSLGRGQRRPDHPAPELGGDERCAGDDHGDLREHDSHEPHLDEVVVAAEDRVGLLLGGEERRDADHEDAA